MCHTLELRSVFVVFLLAGHVSSKSLRFVVNLPRAVVKSVAIYVEHFVSMTEVSRLTGDIHAPTPRTLPTSYSAANNAHPNHYYTKEDGGVLISFFHRWPAVFEQKAATVDLRVTVGLLCLAYIPSVGNMG